MKRILVVDDERLVADTLSTILNNFGFDTRTAYSTDEALACADTFLPDLLLCDITMPQRDGIDLMAAVCRAHPECRVLVLTGYDNNVRRAREESAAWERPVSVLTKPCPPHDLLRRVEAILGTALAVHTQRFTEAE